MVIEKENLNHDPMKEQSETNPKLMPPMDRQNLLKTLVVRANSNFKLNMMY